MVNGSIGTKTGRSRRRETTSIIKNQESGQPGIHGAGDLQSLKTNKQKNLISFFGLRTNKNLLKDTILMAENIKSGCGGAEKVCWIALEFLTVEADQENGHSGTKKIINSLKEDMKTESYQT